MPDKDSKNTQSPQEDSKKSKSSSWGVIILLLIFFWPIGLYLLIRRLMNDNNIKINLTAEGKKKLLIATIAVIVISIPISIVSMLIMKTQTEADIAAHSLNIDNAEGGEITVDCNIVEGSRNCEQIKISGTYANGRDHYIPIADNEDVEISLKGDNGFYLSYTATLESSTATIPEKSIKLCFSKYQSSHYCSLESSGYPTYNLIVNVKISDEDRQKVKVLEEKEEQQQQEEERQKQEEEEKKKAEEEVRKAEAAKNSSSSSSSSSSNSSSGSSSSSSSPSSSSSSSQKYVLKTISAGESCPSNAKFCNISGKSEGYPAYNYAHMRGTIINNSGRSYSYLQITADVYNAAGSKIGSCWDNISGLAVGETWEYDAYCDAWVSGASVKNGDVSGW